MAMGLDSTPAWMRGKLNMVSTMQEDGRRLERGSANLERLFRY